MPNTGTENEPPEDRDDDIQEILEIMQSPEIKKPETHDYKVVKSVRPKDHVRVWAHCKTRWTRPAVRGETYAWSAEVKIEGVAEYDPTSLNKEDQEKLEEQIKDWITKRVAHQALSRDTASSDVFVIGYSWINRKLQAIVRRDFEQPYMVRLNDPHRPW